MFYLGLGLKDLAANETRRPTECVKPIQDV
ncbi:predicted protein [Sclerotinia sclerotiorum 1980 UF-70]|uniref:Uncharacterized protein n=1 Tax=Sclerotinia sclerotiorum (strain ATCC 18683 / 1980 / Ss-1) TaxID=665079 RepID=A7F1E1_SCLS1|nr:predicted protein [Sclerotinia sclerotiorum 1980 UF-70]EDN95533.1 predicted protein [Sclerotinia sclerotiorum 1980 UF-70]